MASYIGPLLYIGPLCLALLFLFRKLARLENRITDREGAEVAFFNSTDDTWAQSLAQALAEHGIPSRVRTEHIAYAPSPRRRVGVFVDPKDEVAAHEVFRAWDATRERSEEEGAV
jgi:hypothetical protein